MKLAFYPTLLIGLLLSPNIGSAQQQPTRPRQLKLEEPDVSISAELEESDDGTYHATFDLGRVPAGRNVVLELKVHNPFDRQINFSGVSQKCKCSNFRPDRYYFSPREELNIRVRLKMPARRDTKNAHTTMIIENQAVPVAELRFRYELEGMLSFTQLVGIIGFDSDNQTRTLEVPFIATSPVDLNKLKISASGELQGCKFEIIPHEEGGLVRVTTSDSILTQSKIRGQVMIEEPHANRRDVFFLTIKNDKLAEISPAVVTFNRDGDTLVATATLKMVNKIEDDSALDQVQLECLHNGAVIPSRLKRISDKLVQVVLSADQALDAGAPAAAKLNWKVVHQGSTTHLETPFVVSD